MKDFTLRTTYSGTSTALKVKTPKGFETTKFTAWFWKGVMARSARTFTPDPVVIIQEGDNSYTVDAAAIAYINQNGRLIELDYAILNSDQTALVDYVYRNEEMYNSREEREWFIKGYIAIVKNQ